VTAVSQTRRSTPKPRGVYKHIAPELRVDLVNRAKISPRSAVPLPGELLRDYLLRRNSGTGGLEDYTKLSAELPVMRRISDIRPGFRVSFFYREDFVYLYDELSSPGKMSSRSCRLPPDSSSWLIPFRGAIAAQARSRPPARLPRGWLGWWRDGGTSASACGTLPTRSCDPGAIFGNCAKKHQLMPDRQAGKRKRADEAVALSLAAFSIGPWCGRGFRMDGPSGVRSRSCFRTIGMACRKT
jgi:hypothetical protein